MKTWLLLILVALGSIVRSQSNYFNKTYVMPNINLASGIIEVDSLYFVVGQQLTTTNKKLILYKLNKKGDTIKTSFYGIDTLNFYPHKIIYKDSNLYVYGSYQQTDFNLSNSSNIFLACFDLDFNLLWMKSYGGVFHSVGKDFKHTKDEGFILTGNTTTSANGNSKVILVKLDSLGNEEWQKKFGGSREDVGYSVGQLFDGGYIVSGYTKQLPMLNWDYQSDFYVIRTDSLGEIVWEKKFGSENNDNTCFVTQLSDSNLLISGAIGRDNISYDMTAYLAKLNLNGEIIWEKKFEIGASSIIYHQIIEDKEKNLLVPNHITYPNNKNLIFLSKFDSIGNELWHREYYTDMTRSQYLYNIQQTKDEGYVMCGSAFDSSQIQRAWVVKTDCYGYDSVTYYFKDSICTLEDCYRYQEDAVFTVSSDTIDLNISAELDVKNSNATNAQLTWSFGDGTQIENQASYTHVYQNPGTYEVQLLFEKGICSLSTKKTIVVLKPSVFNNFALYPNPNDGSFTLVNYLAKATELQLYDALGKLVFNSNITQTQTTFDLNLEIGVYFVTLGDELLQKMVISK